jgi:hypothetical protein
MDWNGYLLSGPHGWSVFRTVQSTTSVAGSTAGVPENVGLEQNYPNPFNPTTKIIFKVRDRESVRLTVFDILGREVTTLVDEKVEGGEHTIEWNAGKLSSGVYYYRLIAGDRVETRKAILMR